MQTPPSSPGVPRLPASHRSQCAGPARHPSRRRQLCHSQASQGQSVARAPSALAHSLHAHLRLLAQPSRTLLCPHHPTCHPSWLVRFHHRPRQKNRPLHPNPQRKFTPLRVDSHSRLDPPEARATLSANFRDRTLGRYDFSAETPSLSAIRTRSTKDLACIFRMIWLRWTFTVASLNFSWSAICLFGRPVMTSSRTSRSRAVRETRRSCNSATS